MTIRHESQLGAERNDDVTGASVVSHLAIAITAAPLVFNERSQASDGSLNLKDRSESSRQVGRRSARERNH